ncbi:unnamed protein product [Acanthoscelides obtectus]|uniref:Transposase n=1 Tax=Acanthoscelides obtectus TaxID=200917 RepID=A0A9P0K6F0_ACAOB|nr:unnamed protein product [Acanthoscelides obtectus]CAK1652010.1 hypothetical protein AOBTE_LOCUS17609 [Acanthoscelides obtectus]
MANLRPRRPLRVPCLTRKQIAAHLQWAREHQEWLLPQWRNVVFTDEVRFGLIQGTMTAEMYEENVIQPIIQPLRHEFGNNFICMNDNARPHRATRVQRALERGQIVRLP